CAERVRRVTLGYTNKKGQPVEGLGGGFAYLRARRMAAESVFNRIQHEQIWTALALIHGGLVPDFDRDAPVQSLRLEQRLILYVPKLTNAVLDAIKTAVTDAG